jgi:quercetin dioxygenase-like cupin family protein
MSAFDHLDTLGPIGIWDGVLARTVDGASCSFGVVELEPNVVVPEHRHPNEQLGIVVSGSVAFRVGEETRELGPGGTWRIPPDVPHEVVTGPDGAVVLDVFSPPRADWAALERTEPRAPRWPA